MNKNLQEKAIGLAHFSEYKFRLGAVVAYEDKVLATGYNIPMLLSDLSFISQHASVHAESIAILRVKDKRLLKKADIYIARVLKDGSLGNACPCPTCRKVIESFGVKNVYHTDENGKWTRWNGRSYVKDTWAKDMKFDSWYRKEILIDLFQKKVRDDNVRNILIDNMNTYCEGVYASMQDVFYWTIQQVSDHEIRNKIEYVKRKFKELTKNASSKSEMYVK
jgi:cytidine deaminase